MPCSTSLASPGNLAALPQGFDIRIDLLYSPHNRVIPGQVLVGDAVRFQFFCYVHQREMDIRRDRVIAAAFLPLHILDFHGLVAVYGEVYKRLLAGLPQLVAAAHLPHTTGGALPGLGRVGQDTRWRPGPYDHLCGFDRPIFDRLQHSRVDLADRLTGFCGVFGAEEMA